MQSYDISDENLVYKQYKLVNKFKDYLTAGNKYTHNTVKNYLSDIRHLLGYMQSYAASDFETLSISPAVMMKYRQSMSSAGTSIITIKRRLSSVQRFSEFLATQVPSVPAIDSGASEMEQEESTRRIPHHIVGSNFYLNTIIQEYVRDQNVSIESKNNVRDFLLLVHS